MWVNEITRSQPLTFRCDMVRPHRDSGNHDRFSLMGSWNTTPSQSHFCIFCPHEIETKTQIWSQSSSDPSPPTPSLLLHSISQGSIQGSFHLLPSKMPPHFPVPEPNRDFSVSLGVNSGMFLFSSSSHHDGHSSGDLSSYPSHYLFILFVTIWKFRSLNISLLLRTVMRLWLPTGEHHWTLTSRHSETHTCIPSRGSIVQARWDVSVHRQASAGELEFAGRLLRIRFGRMIHTASLCGRTHLHTGYYLPYNNTVLSHSSLFSPSLVLRTRWSWGFSERRLIGHFLTATFVLLLTSKEGAGSYHHLGDLSVYKPSLMSPTVSSMLPQTQKVLGKH